MKISKAIIPVAGWGTRRLPITKTIEKCMLPVGNRPIVDYVVQDCIKAGITDIYFVISEDSIQLKSYYSENMQLNDYLEQNGKEKSLPFVTPPRNVNFHYIVQPSGKYGTAIPVALAMEEVGLDEPVVVLMGDDFIYNEDGSSEVQRLLDETGESSLLGVNVPKSEVSRYGVLEMDKNNEFIQVVEKPSIEDAPSTLINVSKYVLSPELLKEVVKYSKEEILEGEYVITEPINRYVKNGGKLKVVQAKGQYLDGGSVDGWLHANNVVCK